MIRRLFRSWIATPRARRALEVCDLVAFQRALDQGADPNAVVEVHRRGTSLLVSRLIHRAVTLHWPDGIAALARAGANLEAPGSVFQATPLFIAVEARDPETVRALAAAGASLDGRGRTMDRKYMAQCEELLGWDHPNQAGWVRSIDTTARALLEEFRNDTALVNAFLEGSIAHLPRAVEPTARAL